MRGVLDKPTALWKTHEQAMAVETANVITSMLDDPNLSNMVVLEAALFSCVLFLWVC